MENGEQTVSSAPTPALRVETEASYMPKAFPDWLQVSSVEIQNAVLVGYAFALMDARRHGAKMETVAGAMMDRRLTVRHFVRAGFTEQGAFTDIGNCVLNG